MPYTEPSKRVYDHSGLSQWMVCQRRWYWYAVRDLELDVTPTALHFGIAIHAGLAAWFSSGSLEKALGAFDEAVDGIAADELRTRAKGELILKAYAAEYPRPEPFKVVALETPFELEMPNGSKLAGRMDGLVEWDGRLLVLEHKTTSGGIGAAFFKQFSPNLQVDIYCYAAQRIFGRCDGALIDALQVCKTKEGFARSLEDRTERQLQAFERRYAQIVADVEAKGFEKEPRERFIQNQTACTYYGECPYRTLCLYDNDGLIEGRYRERRRMEMGDGSD